MVGRDGLLGCRRLSLIGAASAAALLPGAAPADGAPAHCGPQAGFHTVLRRAGLRVFRRSDASAPAYDFLCRAGRRTVFRLDDPRDPLDAGFEGDEVLASAGPFVAFGTSAGGGPGDDGTAIFVADSRDGRAVLLTGSGGATSVSPVLVGPTGCFAALSTVSGDAAAPQTTVVGVAGTLDAGPDISHLALAGCTVSWLDAGQARSATEAPSRLPLRLPRSRLSRQVRRP